jgi:hypothetical protein
MEQLSGDLALLGCYTIDGRISIGNVSNRWIAYMCPMLSDLLHSS